MADIQVSSEDIKLPKEKTETDCVVRACTCFAKIPQYTLSDSIFVNQAKKKPAMIKVSFYSDAGRKTSLRAYTGMRRVYPLDSTCWGQIQKDLQDDVLEHLYTDYAVTTPRYKNDSLFVSEHPKIDSFIKDIIICNVVFEGVQVIHKNGDFFKGKGSANSQTLLKETLKKTDTWAKLCELAKVDQSIACRCYLKVRLIAKSSFTVIETTNLKPELQ